MNLKSHSYFLVMYLFFAVCADLGINCRLVWAEKAEFVAPSRRAARVVKEKPKEKQRFSEYVAQKKQFRQLFECADSDGRLDSFCFILEPHVKKDKDCIACKPLFKALSKACVYFQKAKVRKKEREEAKRRKLEKEAARKAEEGEEDEDEAIIQPSPSPTVLSKQREPNICIVETTLRAFSSIAQEKEERVAESLVAVDKLVAILRDPLGKTAGERDYYGTLAEFIYAPFSELADKRARQRKKEAKAARGQKSFIKEETANVDDMFEY